MTSQTGTAGAPPATGDGAIASPGEDARTGLGVVFPAARLACPRCDHDLRAEPMGWGTGCPLSGRCPECGLDFSWSAVLSRRNALPSWSVEGADGLGAWLRRWPAQAFMAAVRPGAVHGRLRLEHRRRPWRLAAACFPYILAFLLAPIVATGFESARAGLPPSLVVRDMIEPLRNLPSVVQVPITDPRVRGREWLLNPNYGWIGTAPGNLVGRPVRTVDELESLSFGEQTFLALRTAEGVTVGIYTTSAGVVSPNVVATFRAPVNVPITGPTPWFSTTWWWARCLTFGAPIIGVAVFSAGAFAFLPVVRRRARVTAGHVMRLLLLGLLLALPVSLLLGVAATVEGWRFGSWFLTGGRAGGAVDDRLIQQLGMPVALMLLASFLWIWSAAARHLRLERPAAVAGATALVGTVATTTIWFLAIMAS